MNQYACECVVPSNELQKLVTAPAPPAPVGRSAESSCPFKRCGGSVFVQERGIPRRDSALGEWHSSLMLINIEHVFIPYTVTGRSVPVHRSALPPAIYALAAHSLLMPSEPASTFSIRRRTPWPSLWRAPFSLYHYYLLTVLLHVKLHHARCVQDHVRDVHGGCGYGGAGRRG